VPTLIQMNLVQNLFFKIHFNIIHPTIYVSWLDMQTEFRIWIIFRQLYVNLQISQYEAVKMKLY
jgi:hypothetical protein